MNELYLHWLDYSTIQCESILRWVLPTLKFTSIGYEGEIQMHIAELKLHIIKILKYSSEEYHMREWYAH